MMVYPPFMVDDGLVEWGTAKAWIERKFRYLRHRPDLCAEPFGWKLPIPVRVAAEHIERKKARK